MSTQTVTRSGGGLRGTLASEWLKLRSVRSTWAFVATLVAAIALGAVVSFAMVSDYDSSSLEEKLAFESADPSALIIPIAQFCLAALGAMVVTSEYATGMIRTSLTAVPKRARIFAAKAAIVAAASIVLSLALVYIAHFIGRAAAGDRPEPIAVASLADSQKMMLASALSVVVMGLLGVGLGAVLRSTAGALVSLSGLMFVLPIAAQFLPREIGEKVQSSLIMQLPAQMAGSSSGYWGAGAATFILALYAIVPLAAGAILLKRRDA